MKKLTLLVLALLLVTSGLVTISGQQVEAASTFKAGKIISDSNFFNGKAMTAEQIQQFLNLKMPDCDTNGEGIYQGTTRAAWTTARGNTLPFICLKDYRDDVEARPTEEGLCDGFGNASNRTAAQIIDLVARSCGVSQKALLVLLEKEQSLVTDDWPWGKQYRSATGYGCPDTADCDDRYYGFFNQVYQAARAFKRYAKNGIGKIPGEKNKVYYNPNLSECGFSMLLIENQATAGLYTYTPYQPNAGVIANKTSGGRFYSSSPPDCGAYGNINFWQIYTNWFGDTLSESQPLITITGDFGASGADEVGFKRGAGYNYDLDNDGVAEVSFGIGRASDKVIVGDWDGDGKDEIGLRRGAHYYFDTNNDGDAEYHFGIGRSTDEVIVGDWDGDGDDSIGLKRGNRFYLENDNNGSADAYIGMGRATDQVIVGDWNGDGHDRIGLRRGNRFYIDTDGTDSKAEIYFGLGRATDQVIVGDWDNNNRETIGLKRGNSYYLDNNNNSTTEVYVGLGRDSDQVIVGDWDADGDDSLGLKRYNRIYYDYDNNSDTDASFTLNYF